MHSDSFEMRRPKRAARIQTDVLKTTGRMLIVFLPFAAGFLWVDDLGLSITWSLLGSVSIALIAQTVWFRQPGDRLAVANRLMRPGSMFHLVFVAYHVFGAAAYALDSAGYSPVSAGTTSAFHYDLSTIAECQRLMLLGHASVTVGMKLVGFRYPRPKYTIARVPSYFLLGTSILTSLVGTMILSFPSFNQLGYRLLDISTAALLLEIALSIRFKRRTNLLIASGLLLLTMINQAVSGWKGLTLWTMIALSALIYPMMSKRIVLIMTGFVVFWALFLYPFGAALRPLLWYQGMEHDRAIEISMEQALNMSFDDRLNDVWTMMVGRANDLYQFGRYVQFVPETHAYYGFDLAGEGLVALVPRVIWPEKPDIEKIAMGRVYSAGVVSREATVSAKSNFFQDGYLSAGSPGVLIACLIFGALTMLLSHLCETLFGGYEIGTCLIFTGLFGSAIDLPPAFIFFTGTIWTGIILAVTLFLIGRSMGWIIPAGHEILHTRRRIPPLSFAGSSSLLARASEQQNLLEEESLNLYVRSE